MRAWLAGLVTGAVGLVVAVAVTALLRLRLDPVTAVAETVVELTPGPVAHFLVELVGQWDKPLLIGGTVLGLAGLSALAGWLGRRSGRGAGRRSSSRWRSSRPSACRAAPRRGRRRTCRWWPGRSPGCSCFRSCCPARGTRRVTAGSAAGCCWSAPAGSPSASSAGSSGGSDARWSRRSRRSTCPSAVGRCRPARTCRLADLSPWRTPNSDFYRIDTAFAVPTVRPEEWRLRIHGLVDRELEITYDDLLERQLTEAWVTLCCVSNPVGGDLIGNAWWSGVRVADLLAEAGVQAGADAVRQTSTDGWTCGTPLEALTDDRDALLAVAMNGRPLPVEHGFPVRMVVPGLYGYVSATKWVTDLEVTRFDAFEAFWTTRGWSEEGPVRTQSRIDVPRSNHRVEAGEVTVAGVAWAQHTGIERVEVQVDGGGWQEVALARVPSVDTWVQWRGAVTVEPGAHTWRSGPPTGTATPRPGCAAT